MFHIQDLILTEDDLNQFIVIYTDESGEMTASNLFKTYADADAFAHRVIPSFDESVAVVQLKAFLKANSIIKLPTV